MSREQGSKRDSRQRTVQAAGGGRMCGVLDGRGTQGRPQLGPLKTLAWLHCTIHWHVGNTTACLRERVAARKTARRGEGEVATRRGARKGPRARRQPSRGVCSVPACAVQSSLLPSGNRGCLVLDTTQPRTVGRSALALASLSLPQTAVIGEERNRMIRSISSARELISGQDQGQGHGIRRAECWTIRWWAPACRAGPRTQANFNEHNIDASFIVNGLDWDGKQHDSDQLTTISSQRIVWITHHQGLEVTHDLSYTSNNSRISEIGHKILIQPIWYPTFSPQKLENTSLGVQKVVQSVCVLTSVRPSE